MKLTKRVLIILFIIQLVFPSALAISGAVKRGHFNKYAAEYKVRVERVVYDNKISSRANVEIDGLSYLSYLTNEDKYVIFTEDENGFFVPKATSKIPENKAYINIDDGRRSYEYEKAKINGSKVLYEEFVSFYDRSVEESNLSMKLIVGKPTEAYALIKVYENKLEMAELYINGIEFSEYLEKCYNGEIDLSRYDSSLSYDAPIDVSSDETFYENATQIKVKVNEINCEYYDISFGNLSVEIDDNSKSIYDPVSDEGYFVFAEGENGKYIADFTPERPSHPLYAQRDILYYSLVYDYELKNDDLYNYYESSDLMNVPYFSVYSDDDSKNGDIVKIAQPSAEVYAVLNVYCGVTELVDVYIDGVTLDEYLRRFLDGELDLTYYNECLKDVQSNSGEQPDNFDNFSDNFTEPRAEPETDQFGDYV